MKLRKKRLYKYLYKQSFGINEKFRMTQAPVLAMPDFLRPFVLDTDAYNHIIGAVLMQDTIQLLFSVRRCLAE